MACGFFLGLIALHVLHIPRADAVDDPVVRARLLSGRALALEGVSDWTGALRAYQAAMAAADAAGESPDPYIVNSIGNCHNSLGQWADAREAYLTSSQLFQQARGFRVRHACGPW